jgi:hypothetical protein
MRTLDCRLAEIVANEKVKAHLATECNQTPRDSMTKTALKMLFRSAFEKD